MKAGFIGIGQMGRHMSRRILEAGNELVVHDLNKEAVKPLLDKGARWADSPRLVAEQCRLVITCLPSPDSVKEVVLGAEGLKTGWKKDDIYIDMSTNSPTLIRKIAAEASKQGVSVLDAPVSGGTGGAAAGTLTIMAGGDQATLEKARPVLSAMGAGIFNVGGVGCGNIAKLVNNIIALACESITAEGFTLGVKAGIDPEVLCDIIKISTGNNWSLQQYPRTVFAGNFEPGFKVSLANKDIGLALGMADENRLSMPVTRTVKEELEAAIRSGYADRGINALILNLEKEAGVQVRAKIK